VEYNELIPLMNVIDLSRNNLSGEIPPEISNLSTLMALIVEQPTDGKHTGQHVTVEILANS